MAYLRIVKSNEALLEPPVRLCPAPVSWMYQVVPDAAASYVEAPIHARISNVNDKVFVAVPVTESVVVLSLSGHNRSAMSVPVVNVKPLSYAEYAPGSHAVSRLPM